MSKANKGHKESEKDRRMDEDELAERLAKLFIKQVEYEKEQGKDKTS